MATWDSKEREQFRIDADNLKNEIDKIQSEKINLLRDDIHKLNGVLALNKIDIEDKVTNAKVNIQRLNTIVQVQSTSISNLEDDLIKFQESNENLYKKIKLWYFINVILVFLGFIALLKFR